MTRHIHVHLERRARDAAAVTEQLFVQQGGKRYQVASLEEAARLWERYRQESGGGVSEIGNGVVVKTAAGRVVGRVSYNGRIWPA